MYAPLSSRWIYKQSLTPLRFRMTNEAPIN